MIFDQWQDRWLASIKACERIGGKTNLLTVKPPASLSEVETVEQRLGFQLPDSFRKVLCDFSSGVNFYWFLPEGFNFPEPFQGIFRGNCSWDLKSLENLEQNRKTWISICFPNPSNPYDAVWHNKLEFLEVGNGDILGIDLSTGSDGPVVYASHDGSDGHGYLLGETFIDFIDRWSRLGCPGSEDWQMLPFLSDSKSYLDPDCHNAQEWRKLFGLDFG